VTQTDILEQRSSGPIREEEKICHIVEHDDPDRALCGKDVTGYPWNPPWPICVVCVDLFEQSRGRYEARPAELVRATGRSRIAWARRCAPTSRRRSTG
jgi:hypothetical protein